MRKRRNTLSLLTIVLAAFTLIFTGCGSKGSTQGSDSSDQSASAKTKIVIATGGMPKPFTYVNDKN